MNVEIGDFRGMELSKGKEKAGKDVLSECVGYDGVAQLVGHLGAEAVENEEGGAHARLHRRL